MFVHDTYMYMYISIYATYVIHKAVAEYLGGAGSILELVRTMTNPNFTLHASARSFRNLCASLAVYYR